MRDGEGRAAAVGRGAILAIRAAASLYLHATVAPRRGASSARHEKKGKNPDPHVARFAAEIHVYLLVEAARDCPGSERRLRAASGVRSQLCQR